MINTRSVTQSTYPMYSICLTLSKTGPIIHDGRNHLSKRLYLLEPPPDPDIPTSSNTQVNGNFTNTL